MELESSYQIVSKKIDCILAVLKEMPLCEDVEKQDIEEDWRAGWHEPPQAGTARSKFHGYPKE